MTEWEALKEECLRCQACTLAATRTNVVFGVGSEDAEVLFIGEAPGADEDAQGEPFVGRAGKLLDDMLAMIGLDRSRIYITNSVKCRPPQNRDPLNTEKDACHGYLARQLALMFADSTYFALHPPVREFPRRIFSSSPEDFAALS